jgi:hypothetical protein
MEYVVDDNTHAADIILDNSDIIYSKKTDEIFYRYNHHEWRFQNIRDLVYLITDFNLRMNYSTKKRYYNKSYSNALKIAKCIIKQVKNRPDKSIDFDERVYNSTVGKMCFDNGIYNFSTKEFIPWDDPRSNDIYTTIIIEDSYNPIVDPEAKKYLLDLLSDNFEGMLSEILSIISRSLAGYSDNRWITLFGCEDSIQWIIGRLLMNSFTDYVVPVNSKLFVKRRKSIKDKNWIIPHRFSRLVCTDDITRTINGDLIKELCSGEVNVQDVLIKHHFTYMMFCADMGKIVPKNATENRVITSFRNQYVSQKDITAADGEYRQRFLRLAIPNVRDLLYDKKYIDAFRSIIFDHFVDYKPGLVEITKGVEHVDSNKHINKYFTVDTNDESLFMDKATVERIFQKMWTECILSDELKDIKRLLVRKGAVSYKGGLRYVREVGVEVVG